MDTIVFAILFIVGGAILYHMYAKLLAMYLEMRDRWYGLDLAWGRFDKRLRKLEPEIYPCHFVVEGDQAILKNSPPGTCPLRKDGEIIEPPQKPLQT